MTVTSALARSRVDKKALSPITTFEGQFLGDECTIFGFQVWCIKRVRGVELKAFTKE